MHEDFDIDEETRFSSVYRGKRADDSGFDEDVLFETRSSDTFGGVFGSVVKRSSEISGGKGNDGARALANSSVVSPELYLIIHTLLLRNS